MRQPSRNSGFVLVLVLMVVAICGTVLAASARRCGQTALRANSALREIQFRWGAASSRTALLPQADKLLDEDRQLGMPVNCFTRRTVTLGGMKFYFVVSDETAKANANVLARQHDSAGLVAALGRLQANSRQSLTIELRPRRDVIATTQEVADLYASFDQVFAFRSPAELIGRGDGEIPAATRRLTFWGQGPINIRRADLVVLRDMLAGLLNESDLAALDSYRRNVATFTTTEALAKMQLSGNKLETVTPLVTDTGSCFSLWVSAQGPNRDWHRLYIQQEPKDGVGQLMEFAWQP